MADEFTLTPMRRLLKRFGDIRVSEEAVEEMRIIIGDFSLKIAEFAVENARNEKRNTVNGQDLKNAYVKVTQLRIIQGKNHE